MYPLRLMTNKLREIMSGLPTRVQLVGAYEEPKGAIDTDDAAKEVTVVFSFCETGFGFGEFCIRSTPDGVFVDTEAMGVAKIKHYLGLLLDSAITDCDGDPEKHRQYCEAMNRTCGPACPHCGGITQLKRIEAQLADRLGLKGDVREQLVQLAKDNQLVEDELVADWHAGYAWYLAWRKDNP